MNFSEDEIKEIEKTATTNEVIAKLWREHKLYSADAGKQFYKSIQLVTRELGDEFANIVEGKSVIKHRLLQSDPKIWKRISGLLLNSKKILSGLDYVGKEVNGRNKIVKILTQKSEVEFEEEDNETPLIDQLANKNKAK